MVLYIHLIVLSLFASLSSFFHFLSFLFHLPQDINNLDDILPYVFYVLT